MNTPCFKDVYFWRFYSTIGIATKVSKFSLLTMFGCSTNCKKTNDIFEILKKFKVKHVFFMENIDLKM